jgi:restriction system protein
MSGFQFEKFCGKLFEALGHKVEYTPDSNDYGRDLILNDNTFVECKHYTGDSLQIGRVICEKLIGSMEAFNITEGIIMTTGQIHQNAYEYADRLLNKHLSFIKLEDIMEMIDKIEPVKISLMIESSFSYPEEKFTTILKEIYE